MPRGLWIAVILAVLFSIVYGWHYLLYRSALHFFGISGSQGRRIVGLALFLLPASFFLTAFLSRRLDLDVLRPLVLVSHLWLGIGLALLLSFALAWMGWGLSRWHNPRPSPVAFGVAALLLTAACSAYGIWNASTPRVNSVTVRMSNLPPPWIGRTIVQLSDVHLGPIHGKAFLERVVRMVNAQQPAIVLITGDLYDGEDHNLEQFNPLLDSIEAPLGVYFVTGNHETYVGLDHALGALARTRITVLNDQLAEIDGLQIVGLSYPPAGFSRNMAAVISKLSGFDPSRPSILLYHSPTQLQEVKSVGIRLQVSGHTHSGQLFPLNLITRLIYGKYHHGLHEEDGFAVYTSYGTGTWGPLMRTSGHSEITVLRLEPR
mgnify:CR=1 FL=1